jgi:hypothetical protein
MPWAALADVAVMGTIVASDMSSSLRRGDPPQIAYLRSFRHALNVTALRPRIRHRPERPHTSGLPIPRGALLHTCFSGRLDGC